MTDPQAAAIPRHFGLDWLRIAAFGLLIAFHIGLYFAPGHWIVKSPEPIAWLAWPLAAIVPWRLPVLFAVSGYATAAMLQRHPGLAEFLIERSKRLLIPLVFGMVVVVPPQEWVRLEVGGKGPVWSAFLGHEAISFARHAGAFMPGWEHLWFLPYLWAYTAILVGLIALLPDWRARAEGVVTWLAQGRRLLWAPATAIAAGMALLSRIDVQGLADSADYLPAFLLGFAYAHVAQLRGLFRRHFALAAATSVVALGTTWALMALGPIVPDRLATLTGLLADAAMSWAMILVCFNLAERLLNRDHRWRGPLAAAVFPAFIVHQTAIVLVGWQLGQLGVVGLPAFAFLLATVAAACAVAWQVARVVPGAGMLLGMPMKAGRARGRAGALSPT